LFFNAIKLTLSLSEVVVPELLGEDPHADAIVSVSENNSSSSASFFIENLTQALSILA
jgi:hypothetical protein